MADDVQFREVFQVAYATDDPNDHSMDVDALAPALLGFGRLIRASNAELNQDRAAVKLVVASNFEHGCFSISFEAIQTFWSQVTDFLDSPAQVENLKEILKKIGIIVGTPTAIVGTVFGYLKWKKGRKAISVEHSPGAVTVVVPGNNNVVLVDPIVYRLAENRQVLQAVEERRPRLSEQFLRIDKWSVCRG